MNPGLTRRQVMQGLGATVGAVGALGVHNSASALQSVHAVGAYSAARLPDAVRSRFVHNINGLTVHVLEAGWQRSRPGLLLLHGFPELAYSGCSDERTLRRDALASLQHHRRPTSDHGDARSELVRRSGRASTTAKALPALLHHSGSERRHAARVPGHPRLSPRLLPLQKCRLAW